MNERVGSSRIEKIERFLGLGALRTISARSFWIYLVLYCVAIISQVPAIVIGGTEVILRSAAFIVFFTAMLGTVLGGALYAGVLLGGRYRERGRTLRIVAYIVFVPASVAFLSAIGYMWFDLTGALVGGAVMALCFPLDILLRRQQESARESVRSERR